MTRIASFFTILAGSALLVLALGCGKSSPAPAPMPEKSRVEQNLAEKTGLANQNADSQKNDQKPKKKKKRKVTPEVDPKEDLPEELRVPEVTLPVESSQWSEAEFTCIRTSQPLLFDSAISELSRRLANPDAAENAARILARFVQSVVPAALAQEQKLLAEAEKMKAVLEESEQEDRRGRKDPQANAKPIELNYYMLSQNQIRQAMGALAGSTSETAEKQVAAFLAGAIQTDENKAGLEAVLDAYAQKTENEKLSADEENLLLAFLLMPEKAVAQAAGFAEVEAPQIPEEELDENGNPIQRSNQNGTSVNLRGNHQPILIAPNKRVQFRFSGGTGNMTSFTCYDVQKLVLTKFCPVSSPLFRASIARKLTEAEVMEAANTQARQDFLLNDVLDRFLMKKDFANALAHVLIYQQPDLDDSLKTVLEENLFLSHLMLMQYQFGLIDGKTIQDYRAALLAKRNRLAMEESARSAAESSSAQTSTAQAPASLLSRKAAAQSAAARPNSQGNRPQAVQYPPMVELLMNPNERKALEKEIWTQEMRTLLREKLNASLDVFIGESLANMPEPGSNVRPKAPNFQKSDLQTIQMFLAIPCIETRAEIYALLDRGWLLGPEAFRLAIFDKLETEPGFLMVVKSMDRRAKPKEKEKNPNIRKPNRNSSVKRRPTVKPKTPSMGVLMREKRLEVGAAWLDQSCKLVCQWCWKFSQAAKAQKDLMAAERILNRNAPKASAPELSDELRQQFPFPQGSEVVAWYSAADPAMPPISEASGLKITYFEVRCHGLLPKLASVFKSKNPRMLDRGILIPNPGTNAILNANWLERWEVNKETGKRESIDILIAPTVQVANNQNQNRGNDENVSRKKGPEDYTVYVLMMEMDDLTGEHQSQLKASDEDENVEFSDESGEGGDEDDDESDGEEMDAYQEDGEEESDSVEE